MRERLEERLGDRLRAVGRLIADAAVNDVEKNLEIESVIGSRREAHRELQDKIREALAGKGDAGPKKKAPRRG